MILIRNMLIWGTAPRKKVKIFRLCFTLVFRSFSLVAGGVYPKRSRLLFLLLQQRNNEHYPPCVYDLLLVGNPLENQDYYSDGSLQVFVFAPSFFAAASAFFSAACFLRPFELHVVTLAALIRSRFSWRSPRTWLRSDTAIWLPW